jgi:nucleotide-binding universal stress UspA family protein
MFRTIIVPVDLEEESSWRKALPVAIDYARHAAAELHVITVVPDHMLRMTVVAQLIPENYDEKLMSDASERLSRLLEATGPDDMTVHRAVRLGSIYKEIIRYARDNQADLIIMAAHRPELSDYLLGPNAAQVVRHADCSVWTIRD